MAGIFGNKYNGEERSSGEIKTSTLGRGITSIEGATAELFKKPEQINPSDGIADAIKRGHTYYGRDHMNDGKVISIKDSDITHEIFVGSTGTGKGVLIGNKTFEAIEQRRGLIIIDPKKDSFLPQIAKEILERQGRGDDFQVVSWPENFGYTAINENDTYIDIANKLIDALGLEETGDGGVDYYRKNERVLLKKILKIFFDGRLGVIVKKDFSDILFHIQKLKEDMERGAAYEREMSKNRPNNNLLQKLSHRFFDANKIEEIYWDSTTPETLDSLAKSLSEIADAANIYKKYDLSGALYGSKILYLHVDMLDLASLKMVKMTIADAIMQARKKRANCTIVADELSFYANKTIAGALATVRSMGLKFILALQDLAQMPDGLREAILSNCNAKFFYKISDAATLDYVTKLGGKVPVTNYSAGGGGDGGYKIAQNTEDNLNATRVRAMPRQAVGILIAEALPTATMVQTNFIPVKRNFDWDKYETPQRKGIFDDLEVGGKKTENYRVRLASEKRLLENSDLFGYTLECEALGDL